MPAEKPTINDLPRCLRPLALDLATDETDDLLLIFTLIGSLSAVAGHLVDEVSEYRPGVFTANPITVNNIIIADSGSGKSRMCKLILKSIKEYIAEKLPAYEDAMDQFKAQMRQSGGKFTVQGNEFGDSPLPMPKEPPSPNFITEDFTIESLFRAYHIGSEHMFVYSDEGGGVISSRAFGRNSINTTLTFFNKIMCGDTAVVSTVKDGPRTLSNKRLTLLLLMQNSFFNDFIERSSMQACAGTFQRIFPIKTKSKRKLMADKIIKSFDIDRNYQASKTYTMFSDFCAMKPKKNKNRELKPEQIKKSKEAHAIWFKYFIEQNDFCALNPNDESVSYRLRNVETAARYAALFQVGNNCFNDQPLSAQVSANNMRRAIKICRYGLERQIIEFVKKDAALDKIGKILSYIKRSNDAVSRIKLMRNLSRDCRAAKTVDNALLFLIDEGYLEKTVDGFKFTGKEYN